jgi:hypothetical protein
MVMVYDSALKVNVFDESVSLCEIMIAVKDRLWQNSSLTLVKIKPGVTCESRLKFNRFT